MTQTAARSQPKKDQKSKLYVFTKRASGGSFSDAGSTSIHLPAKSLKQAKKIAFKRRLRLDGKLIK